MEKVKQIREMAIELCVSKICHKKMRAECIGLGDCNKSREIADALYNAGYRKQSEGEWIVHEDDWCGTYYTCSVCGCDWTTIDGTPQENNMRYCPECGAKMKGGE